MVYEPCDVDYTGSEDARLECVIDKAFVNLGGMMADRVGGLVSVEIVEDKATALSTGINEFSYSATAFTHTGSE